MSRKMCNDQTEYAIQTELYLRHQFSVINCETNMFELNVKYM